MFIGRYTIRWLLVLTVVMAVLFLVFSQAGRGSLLATGVTAGAAMAAFVILVQALCAFPMLLIVREDTPPPTRIPNAALPTISEEGAEEELPEIDTLPEKAEPPQADQA